MRKHQHQVVRSPSRLCVKMMCDTPSFDDMTGSLSSDEHLCSGSRMLRVDWARMRHRGGGDEFVSRRIPCQCRIIPLSRSHPVRIRAAAADKALRRGCGCHRVSALHVWSERRRVSARSQRLGRLRLPHIPRYLHEIFTQTSRDIEVMLHVA